MGEAVAIIRDAERAATMLQPVRLRILELTTEPASATTLAPRLGIPRQLANYHLRELERAGFVELVEERARRGRTERLYRSVATAYAIDSEALAGVGADPARIGDTQSADYLVALGARLIHDLAHLREDSESRVPTLSVETSIAFASDAERAEFAQDLAAAFTRLASRYHRPDLPGARAYRAVAAVHPEIP